MSKKMIFYIFIGFCCAFTIAFTVADLQSVNAESLSSEFMAANSSSKTKSNSSSKSSSKSKTNSKTEENNDNNNATESYADPQGVKKSFDSATQTFNAGLTFLVVALVGIPVLGLIIFVVYKAIRR